jgi:hypothetical protein
VALDEKEQIRVHRCQESDTPFANATIVSADLLIVFVSEVCSMRGTRCGDVAPIGQTNFVRLIRDDKDAST